MEYFKLDELAGMRKKRYAEQFLYISYTYVESVVGYGLLL
jgi:hypothetical protein